MPTPPRAPSPTSCAAGPTSSCPRCSRRGRTWRAPAPHDSSQLAARVVVKASVLRALDGLDALELAVLQALVQETDPAAAGSRAASRSRRRSRAAAHARAGVGYAGPAGAGRRRAAAAPRRPAARRGPRPARRPGRRRPGRSSTTSTRPAPTAGGAGARDRRPTWSALGLLAHGRRAARARCRGRCGWPCTRGRHASTSRPTLATSERDAALVDRAAAGAAFELVRRTELLLDRWGTHPPGRAEGRRSRRTRPAGDRRPPARRARRGGAGRRDRRGRRPARPGHDRRPRRGLAADRLLRRLAGRRRRPSGGRCWPGPG